MEINLDVYKGVFEHSKEKFELCGWYTDSGNELAIGYISHDKIKELKLERVLILYFSVRVIVKQE